MPFSIRVLDSIEYFTKNIKVPAKNLKQNFRKCFWHACFSFTINISVFLHALPGHLPPTGRKQKKGVKMTTMPLRFSLLLLVALLFIPNDALIPSPAFRRVGLKSVTKLPPRSSIVAPRHFKVVKTEANPFNGTVKRFLTSLSKGIFFAVPMNPSIVQTLFGIKGVRKNEKKNPASPAATVSFSLRECFLSIGVYLLLGICAFSILMEHWSIVDAVYFSICTFTTGKCMNRQRLDNFNDGALLLHYCFTGLSPRLQQYSQIFCHDSRIR